MHVATLWRTFRLALLEAGIKRSVGVHATRHAAGFLLLRATGDLTKVQEFLRHSSLQTTAAWYRHVHMPDLRAGIEKAGL
jgi:site-specific recombinase XerD